MAFTPAINSWDSLRPVVTTSAGGSAEVVEHGVSGLVVKPGDPEALANAVYTVLSDPELASRYSRAAGARVRDHFSCEAMLNAIDRLYTTELRRVRGTSEPAPGEPHTSSRGVPDTANEERAAR